MQADLNIDANKVSALLTNVVQYVNQITSELKKIVLVEVSTLHTLFHTDRYATYMDYEDSRN